MPKLAAPRVILHADMDAFYASVEQRDDPKLRGQPVIIGAQSPRGVVAAASYEARQFGVRSAMPGFEARRLCPQGIYLAGDMKKYAAVSRQIHGIFAEFTDQIEPLALDEAFLDITGSIRLLGPPETIGRQLKDRVLSQTDLRISVGIGSSKLVAKIACSQGKPDGLRLVPAGTEAQLLSPLPLRALFGIGPKTAARLESVGFHTIGDLAQGSLPALRGALGRHAEQIQERARGIDERPVLSDRKAKSIGEEATFPDDVPPGAHLESALAAHVETVASRARRAGVLGSTITVKVKLARRNRPTEGPLAHHELFPQRTRQSRLPFPTSDGSALLEHARRLLGELRLSEPVRLLGVALSDFNSADDARQLGLFDPPRSAAGAPPETRDRSQLGAALDAINDKFGQGAIGRAVRTPEKVTASNRVKLGESSPSDPPSNAKRSPKQDRS